MARFARAEIYIDALQHNFRMARDLAGSGNRVLAIVKANGYGHGAVAVARALPDADMFGVACIEEALELVESGIRQPVLLLEGFFELGELPDIARFGFDVVIHSREQMAQLLAAHLQKPVRVWLKYDSGLHRLGFTDAPFRQAYHLLKGSPNVSDIRLMSHFASADELDADGGFTVDQIGRFDRATGGLKGDVSLANSAGLLAWPSSRRGWVRPGLMLYGGSPFTVPHAVADRLRPVMTLSSRIIAIRELRPGDAVGYGRTWRADKNTRVGTVAMGYGDGYPRHTSQGMPVLVNGQRTTVLGRVSMDMLSVDLTELPNANVGDLVMLWGEGLPTSEVAPYAGTVPWALLTGITGRVPKEFVTR